MSLIGKIQSVKALLNIDPVNRADFLNQPTGTEVGMRHPHSDAYLLLRDDEVAEIGGSANCSMTMDGSQGLTHLKSSAIAIESQYLHLHTPANGLYFGYTPFNSYWQGPGPILDLNPEDILLRSPVVFNSPLTLDTVILAAIPPETVPVPVPLITLMHPAGPLFLPNEELLILGRNMASLLTMLASI